jgi:hypothetical protein
MKIFIGCLVVAVFLVSGILLVSPPTSAQKGSSDDATSVESGRHTDQERAFSQALDKLYPRRNKTKLSLLYKEDNEPGIGIGGISDYATVPGSPEMTTLRFVKNLSCNADAVVVGRTTTKMAHLSEDETFAFTQYDLSVQEVVKDNRLNKISVDKIIQVVRPGGDIKLEGRTIHVKDFSFEQLDVKKDFLLFLKYIPAADGYLVMREGDFELENGSARKLSQGKYAHIFKKEGNAESVLGESRQVISEKCKEEDQRW